MTDYRLHCFAQSGNAYKAALALNLLGADWTPVFVDFFNGGHRSPEFLAVNPMGEVPVLEGPDGVVSQSGVILNQLARRFGRFGGETDAERDEILRWILWDNHKLTAYTATSRFMQRFLPADKRDPAVIAFLEGRRKIAMKVLEGRLAAQNYVAVPDRLTLADLSCCGYLFWLVDELGDAPDAWPAVNAWLDRIRATQGWVHPYELMPGHQPPGESA